MENVLPFAGMVMVMLLQVSNMVVSKSALSQGLDKYVLIVYSGVLCFLIMFPICFFSHRSENSPRPPLTLDVLCGFIVLAAFSCLGQICENAGILYSSPTLATALLNLIPAFTFILALIFRMEKFRWRSSSSVAKVVGTLVSILGAFVVTFYKGPALMKLESQEPNWILGGFFLTIEALSLSASYIVQALILKKYPVMLMNMFYVLTFTAILSAIVSLVVVRDPSAWRLRLDIGLVAIVYAALSSLLRYRLSLWCLWKAGPLYVSMFKPLAIVFSGVMSVLFLGDVLCLGSVIGAVIIVGGFYAVLWGKAKEKDKEIENGGESSIPSISNKVPLLQNRKEDRKS